MRYIVLIGVILIFCGQSACSRKPKTQAQSEAEGRAAAKTIEVDRLEARGYLEKGRGYYRDDEDTRAAEAFQQALKLDPGLPEAHFRLGLAYDALGKEQEAEAEYKKAVEAYKKFLSIDGNNEDPEAHYNLGQTYAGLHLYSEAVKEYRQATRLKPDDAAIQYDLGLALMKLAQYDDASRAFSKSLELDPDNYRAEDELAEAQEGVKRIRTGKKHQEDLLKKKKDEELKKQEGGDDPSSKPSNPPT
jgi:tetratricopeptide (TPR) repeat protein